MRVYLCSILLFYQFILEYVMRGVTLVEGASTTTTINLNLTLIDSYIFPEVISEVKQSLTIYYGAMDGNSQVFFNKILAKIFNAFYSYYDFNYTPCQKVQILQGELFCTIPGDPSCYTDKLHACAVTQLPDKKQLTDFLICTMQSTDVLPDINQCATTCGINIQNLEACASSDFGKRLCIYFNKQKIPECDTSPGFVFKKPSDIVKPEDFNKLENNLAIENFQATLCAKLRRSKTIPLPSECEQKLLLGIYYNVQDEPSQKWFHSLDEIYNKYAPFYNIKFHPCMFAELVNGKMVCKSDVDKDCLAEKMHACALNHGTDQAAIFKFQTCTMKDPKKLGDFEKCANEHKLNFQAIKDCANSEQGNHLCYEYSKSRPNVDKMPAFAFEAEFNGPINDETNKDLKLVLCQQLRNYNITTLDDCKNNVKLLIFYESSINEFRYYMSSVIAGNYNNFFTFVDFDFVACRGVKEEGGEFKCENSLDPKCSLDIYHACSVKHIQDKSIQYKVLQCLSQIDDGKLPSLETCANICKADFNVLKACAEGEEGKTLCRENLKRVPKNDELISVQINDHWDPEVDKKIRDDFRQGTCEALRNAKAGFPNECY